MKIINLNFNKYGELPIWIFASGDARLGVGEVGWIVDLRGRSTPILDPRDLRSMLPLLEEDRAVVKEHLAGLNQDGIQSSLETSFPEEMLVRCALDYSVSDYWPSKALNWIEQGVPLTDLLVESIGRIKEKKWVGQHLRQRITRMLRGK